MAAPLDIGMPQNLDVGAGYTLRVTAIDPLSGATVSGVKVTQMVIEATGSGDLSSGAFTVANPLLIGISV